MEPMIARGRGVRFVDYVGPYPRPGAWSLGQNHQRHLRASRSFAAQTEAEERAEREAKGRGE
jgi:hypothetical protein